MKTAFWQVHNCYAILGISPTASPQEIKKAYREAALRNHPDRGGSADTMAQVNLANEVLRNPVDRVAHDLRWRVAPKPAAGPSPAGSERPRQQEREQRAREPTPPPVAPRPAPPPPPRARAAPLSALHVRVQAQIDVRAKQIWSELQPRAQRLGADFAKRIRTARNAVFWGLIGSVLLGVGALQFPILWLGAIPAALSFFGNLAGPTINGKSRSPLRIGTAWLVAEAEAGAKSECASQVAGLERYLSELGSIAEQVLRPSTYDDSESQVARKITTAFFVLGYLPKSYSASDRTLVLAAGDDEVVVRFRHRTGASVNVTYVEKLVALIRGSRERQGYLFCSPGLSGNAARLAETNNIRCYTIETMSQWIEDALTADYAGPEGDILENLDKLKEFLGRLSNVLPDRTAGGWRPRRRRWR